MKKSHINFFIMFLMLGLSLVCFSNGALSSDQMKPVGPGILYPFYPPSPQEKEIPIPAFLMDTYLITNGEFLDFVKKNTEN